MVIDSKRVVSSAIEIKQIYETASTCRTLMCINANILVEAYLNKDYCKQLESSDFLFFDGSVLAAYLLMRKKIRVKVVAGPDLFKLLIKDSKIAQLILGGDGDSVEILKRSYPHLNSVSLPHKSCSEFDFRQIAETINGFSRVLVWVSLGAPKQECFSSHLKPHITTKALIIPVGAAIDFEARGNRAPKLWRYLRLEWLYRLSQEPRKTASRLIKEIKFIAPATSRVIWKRQ